MQRERYPARPREVLDDSKVGFHGLERGVRTFSGARGVWVSHPAAQVIGEHRHDWPYLMLPSLGGYRDRQDAGEVDVSGPAVVFHPAGTCHENRIGERGLESLTIEFDPRWLGRPDTSGWQFRTWIGGAVAPCARTLAAVWRSARARESDLAMATRAFLQFAFSQESGSRPGWLGEAQGLLDDPRVSSTAEIARRLRLHPAWLASAYRNATGEGLQATLRRKRLERAVALLRTTDVAFANVASATGFCDQSHMIRAFKAVLGRTPL
jgi:AraC family transcriptional regulator